MTLISEQCLKPTTSEQRKDKEKLPTKVIIRRLPPQMDAETFLDSISPAPQYDYFYLVKGDLTMGEHSFARAYISFTHADDVFAFREKFDNYVFLDSGGHEYPAVVEYAVFQKIPKKRSSNRIDPKCGTIETDPLYIQFLEELNSTPEEISTKPEYTLQLTSDKPAMVDSTPLLDFVKSKRAHINKLKEERREERKRREFERKKLKETKRKSAAKKSDDVVSHSCKSGWSASHIDSVNITTVTVAKNEPKVAKGDSKRTDKYTDQPFKGAEKKRDAKTNYKVVKRDQRSDFAYKDASRDVNRPIKARAKQFSDSDVKPNNQRRAKKYSEKKEERRLESQKKGLDPSGIHPISSDLSQSSKKDISGNVQQPTEGVSSISSAVEASTSSVGKSRPSDTVKHEKPVKEPKCGDDESSQGARSAKDSSSDRRIRNKDRPSIAIYRPGMLSKKKTEEQIDK